MRVEVAERLGWVWVACTSAYVLAATLTAAVGERSESAGSLLAAVVLTLPCGVAGLFGVYGIYGGLVLGARVVGATTLTAAGTRRGWFVMLNGMLVIVMFALLA